MYAYQGGLYRSKSLIVGGKEVSGIWRIDAENIEKEAELVLPITDQWQLNSVNVVRGYSQLSYYDGMLYYNTPRAVWRWNFDPESEPEKVFELDQSIPGEIWDAEAANGKIYYETGVYEKGERQKGQYVFDEDYRKAKHPIAVTKPVMTVVMGGENVFLQSAAPGNVTYTSKNPEICDVQVVWKDESCQLIPKKAGETIVTVHADPTDHYAEGAVDVKVIVKERDDNEEHTHNLTLVAAKAATCTTAGNSAYYTCDGCDKWFADATGSVEITDKTSVKIPAPGHTAGTEWKSDDTNHWHECSRCHDKKDEAAHDYGSDNVCDTCGYYKTVPHTHNLTLVAAKAATCTEGGKEAYYKCEGCGKFYEDVLGTKEITDLASWGNIAKIAHTTKQTVTKATPTANGKIVNYCSVCKKTLSTTVIPKASSIKLKATSLTYNGKVRTPKVIVKDRTGKTLVKNTDYTVSYAKGRKYVGKYAVKITFKGKYSGTKMLYFTIKPKATSISSLTAGSKKFTVKWKKQATQTTGYQVQYSASSKFSKAKTVTVGKNTTVSKKISKLSGKKKYYVRVRTYKTVKINGKSIRIYSGWSKAKTVTTKK
ncbi:fibronectin type III domain-containing protein [[Ruminococcus] torques]|uniref:fibronectin type III domain-containing protein n=1 Tax=[Ruminococcus] torques TaxID=33039 RepID=UPI0032C1A61E